ncbi:hypothetical protein H8959_010062 [Pygathrix nigripes]
MMMLAEQRQKQKWAVNIQNTAWNDFNRLLAELNTCQRQVTTDSLDNTKKKSFSLEEKSKIVKNCVHHRKFTKEKDLSSRSKTDLDCIFGKRQSKKTPGGDSSPSTPDRTKPL